MASTFGGTATSIINGFIPTPKTETEVWRVPGIDGYGIQDLGLGDSAFRMQLINYSTAAGNNTWLGLIEAMQGTSITIYVEGWPATFTTCFITRISQPAVSVATGPAGYEQRMEVRVEGIVLS